jgi:hypothetical protein
MLSIGLLFVGCDKDSEDESDECRVNKWESPDYPIITVGTLDWSSTYVVNPENSNYLNFRFRIYKTYCNGDVSGNFYYEKQFDRQALIDAADHNFLNVSNFVMYNYKIENDKDKITIEAEMELQEVGEDVAFYPLVMVITGEDIRTKYPPGIASSLHEIAVPFEYTGDSIHLNINLLYNF